MTVTYLLTLGLLLMLVMTRMTQAREARRELVQTGLGALGQLELLLNLVELRVGQAGGGLYTDGHRETQMGGEGTRLGRLLEPVSAELERARERIGLVRGLLITIGEQWAAGGWNE